jgi:cytochrome c oxidase assembly factor CtaG
MPTPPTTLLVESILAHGGKPHSLHDLLRTWGLEPYVLLLLALSATLYIVGTARLWKSSRPGAGLKRWEASAFALGWLTLIIALVSPLHPWGRVLFSAHMTQHEILMLLSAPLLVLGRPLIVFLFALPQQWSRTIAHATHIPAWQATWRVLSNPFVAWAIHAVALWIWHVPAFFQATIDNDVVHTFQHTSFLGSALLFWYAVIHGKHHVSGYGMAVLYMFTTALHSSILGALITFTKTIWYPAYEHTTQSWGLTPLEDQQLGGLIMWIPAGLVYIFAGLLFTYAWITESGRRTQAWEASLVTQP